MKNIYRINNYGGIMKQYDQEELAKLKETELCIYEEIVGM